MLILGDSEILIPVDPVAQLELLVFALKLQAQS